MKKAYCNDCSLTKTLGDFYKRIAPSGNIVRTPYCKECMIRRSREWQRKNKAKYRAYQRKWQKEYYKKNHG